jgi:hypothetical protein
MYSQQIVDVIKKANPERSHECIRRRLLKILEELGETSEAYLSRTSASNYKDKTWDDYREEGCDTLIVMLDVALTSLPNSNWPPAAQLTLQLNDGRVDSVTGFEGMEAVKFEVARAVCSADFFLRENDDMGFYGAMARGVKAAAKLCFAKVPGCDSSRIEEQVYSIIEQKIEKWKTHSTVKTPDAHIVPLKPNVAAEVVDASTYFEQIEDRQL